MPPPTGVVSGPLMPTMCSREGGDGLVGQPGPGLVERLLPGQDLDPLDAPAAPAWPRRRRARPGPRARCRRPMPSPRMNGMIGSSGTSRVPSAATVMCSGIGSAEPRQPSGVRPADPAAYAPCHARDDQLRARNTVLGRPREPRPRGLQGLLRRAVRLGGPHLARSFGGRLHDVRPAREHVAGSAGCSPRATRRRGPMYMTAADADATAVAIGQAGGTVFVPPFDVLDAGRMAVCARQCGRPLLDLAARCPRRRRAGERAGHPHVDRARHPRRRGGQGVLRSGPGVGRRHPGLRRDHLHHPGRSATALSAA